MQNLFLICHETSKTSFNNDQPCVKQELVKLLFDLGNPPNLDNLLALKDFKISIKCIGGEGGLSGLVRVIRE